MGRGREFLYSTFLPSFWPPRLQAHRRHTIAFRTPIAGWSVILNSKQANPPAQVTSHHPPLMSRTARSDLSARWAAPLSALPVQPPCLETPEASEWMKGKSCWWQKWRRLRLVDTQVPFLYAGGGKMGRVIGQDSPNSTQKPAHSGRELLCMYMYVHS